MHPGYIQYELTYSNPGLWHFIKKGRRKKAAEIANELWELYN